VRSITIHRQHYFFVPLPDQYFFTYIETEYCIEHCHKATTMLKSILLSTKYTTSSSSSFLESEELVGERFSAIHNDHLVKDDDNNNNNENSYPDYAGNLSFQQASSWCNGNYYSSSFCSTSCSDEHFLQRIVRWVKIIARSQQLMTVVFGFVPLVVGLLIGVYIGRKWEQRQQLRQQQQPKQKAGKLNSSSVLSVWLSESLHFVASKAMWIIGSSITSLVFIIMTAYVPSTEVPFNNDKETRSPEPQKEITEEERLSYIKNPNRYRQSGLETKFLPKHIAIIMDGNRRYGKQKYNSASRGHSDGGYKLRDMVQWCLEECVQEMTVYAFSTENWNRSPTEIDALMTIFVQQCEALRKESIKLQIVVRILSTDTTPVRLVFVCVYVLVDDLKDDCCNDSCMSHLFLFSCGHEILIDTESRERKAEAA